MQRMWTLKKPKREHDLDSTFPGFNLLSLCVLHLPRGCEGLEGEGPLSSGSFFPSPTPPVYMAWYRLLIIIIIILIIVMLIICYLQHSVFVERQQELKSPQL